MLPQRRADGFTLIELMIVVAIIGVLATISTPWYMRFQMRSKAAEVKVSLASIRTAQGAYFGEHGSYIRMDPTPAGPPVSQKRPWTACPSGPWTIAATAGECLIGYRPEGPTFYSYAVATVNANGAAPNVEYFLDAASDIDGDGVRNRWGLRMPEAGGAANVAAGTLGCVQVFDADMNPLTNQIGPCGLGFGTSVF
jgi:prepilin-type N-terminal cleavage/methylation domain-containing protein